MNTNEKRIELAKWILETDARILNEVEAIYNSTFKKKETSPDVVAYTISGESLTKEMYIQKVKEAEKRVNEGEYISHEDLLKEMQSW